ncbi:MAG: bifunctional adenosylcobinamide kinase/adenosylcobinamide-phosphate guanylyltransferase [Gammaproteobacteria bacterium]|nr:bifunctional adenosylcobinamide kinase/adenosylcobinamide-phosphate guanylyltransferase [Gammaproteobacteria bacterium]
MKQLILGGNRSGKSRLAEKTATQIETEKNISVIYIATSEGNDNAMQARVAKHQADRPSHWQTIEESTRLAETLRQHASDQHCILVDCLTLWLTNLLMSDDASLCEKEINNLLEALPELPGHIIFVSNETGLGVIPMGELTRQFCDEAGLLHQKIASLCDRVVFTVAGLPHVLKGTAL